MDTKTLECVGRQRSFGGWHEQYVHQSDTTQTPMRFAIFLPPQVAEGAQVPVLYWLSGLTCTDENFMQKAGAHRIAAELGVAIVAPDTSPRGDTVADDTGYDLGQGAGFYVNATQPPWAAHFQMYEYVMHELPRLIESQFMVTDKRAIAGHSMGGHGALIMALRESARFSSASAFSPICHPSQVPWGKKAFSAYLGTDTASWQAYDASVLMASSGATVPILVDQGLDDSFLAEQLTPQALLDAAEQSGYPLTLRQHEGYDHSYYFIASFIEEHLRFHHKHLSA